MLTLLLPLIMATVISKESEEERGSGRSNNIFKLDGFKYNKDGKEWFNGRVVDDWNKLGSRVVSASRTDAFKRRLDKLVDNEVKWRVS